MPNPVLGRYFGDDRAATAGLDASMAAAPPVTPVVGEVMTIGGTVRATGILLVLLGVGGIYGWTQVTATDPPSFPGWLIWAVLAALGVAIVTVFRPTLARFLGPVYALLEGAVLGAISHVYELAWQGIVLQAVLATLATFVVMLTLYATRTIRVTERLRSVVIGATLGIALFYLVSIVLSLFGVSAILVWDTGLFGILFSVVVVAVAAFNLLLDFDLIERGSAMGAPAHMDWFGAFGLMITIVWLYLEMLRLLAKLRE